MTNWLYHSLVGNDAAPERTGLTRGVVMAAVVGVVNAVLLFIPMDDGQKVQVMTALNPALLLLSYIAYGFLDRWLTNTGRKP